MKKRLFGLFASLMLIGGGLLFCLKPHAEAAYAESNEEEIVYPATVTSATYYKDGESIIVDEKKSRGDIYLSADYGEVGDIVTAIVRGNPGFSLDGTKLNTFKYCVSSVTVNGIVITASEEKPDEYTFTLVAGENKVEVLFDGITGINITDLKTIDWASFLTVENLLTLITWVVTILLSSGFLITLIRSKKFKCKTMEEISQIVKETSSKSINEIWSEFLDKQLKPILEKQGIQNNDIAAEMEVLVRCFLLSQENTPESRLAIAEELEKLRVSDKELGDKVKLMIDEAIKSNEKKREDINKTLNEVKQEIKNLDKAKEEKVETEVLEKDGDNGTQI